MKKIPIVPRITAGAGLLASAIYAGSAPSIGLFSSAAGYAAAGFISPLALLTGIGLAGYQIGKWTGWIK